MWLGWPMLPFTFLLFIGFVPLFFIHDELKQTFSVKVGNKFLRYVWLAMLIWNLFTTWWVWNASPGGAVMAIIANSLLMTIPFAIYHKASLHISEFWSKILCIVLWSCFEYCHQRWDLTWTWINIGNAFAIRPNLIQWYEYTGILGGSLWILVLNILIFKFWISEEKNKKWVLPSVFIIVPVLLSLVIESDIQNPTPNIIYN